MEFENLLRLVDCVSNSGLDSFYYEQNGTKIKLKKSRGGGPQRGAGNGGGKAGGLFGEQQFERD